MSLDSPLLSGGPPRCTLREVYDSIAARFVEGGLRQNLIEDFRSRCTVSGEQAEPLRYDELQPAYPPGAVRLAVLPIQADAELRGHITEATAAVLNALPHGGDFAHYENAAEQWHVTLFHTARLGDSRPDPFRAGGGVRASLDGPTAHPPPDEPTLAREVLAFRAQVVKFQPILLQVYRVIMADSGTLLLCCVDVSYQVQQLRSLLRETLPGAPAQQTSIMHITLARLAGGAAAVTPDVRRRVQAVCDEWSEKLHGQTFVVDQVHHVLEEQFSTVQGRRRSIFRLQDPTSPHSDVIANGFAA